MEQYLSKNGTVFQEIYNKHDKNNFYLIMEQQKKHR